MSSTIELALPKPIITLQNDIAIRPWHPSDAEVLSKQGNNFKIWENMTDRFPHPYTLADANEWISMCNNDPTKFLSTSHPPSKSSSSKSPTDTTATDDDNQDDKDEKMYPANYAITHLNTPIGAIGLDHLDKNGNHILSMGYWLGEDHWGRGLATLTAKAFLDWIFDTFPWCLRVHADAYGWNAGSIKVLRKIGMVEEGRQKCAVEKGGRLGDLVLFGKVRDGVEVGMRA